MLHFLSPNSPRRPHLTGSICTLHWQVPATLGRACCVAATPPLVVVVAFTSKKCRLWSLKKKSSLKCIALAPASSGSSACIQWCKPRALHDAAPARTMVSVSRPASMLLLSPFRFSRYCFPISRLTRAYTYTYVRNIPFFPYVSSLMVFVKLL